MILAVALLLALGAMFYTLFVRQRDIPKPLPVSPIQHLEDRKYAIAIGNHSTYGIHDAGSVWLPSRAGRR